MKLSVIIPVYNEENTSSVILQKIYSQKLSVSKEIIIVNDGSTDQTPEIISKFISAIKSKNKTFKLINLKHNSGKGFAVAAGINKSTGDYLLIQDADLEYNPQDIPQ